MCLLSKNKFPRIALKRILVYKVLEFVPFTDIKDLSKLIYFSPIQHYPYKKGKNYPNFVISVLNKCLGKWSIKSNYLHCFINEQSARKYCDALNKKFDRYCVEKMYIPFGTKYYIGSDNDICAKKLVWK